MRLNRQGATGIAGALAFALAFISPFDTLAQGDFFDFLFGPDQPPAFSSHRSWRVDACAPAAAEARAEDFNSLRQTRTRKHCRNGLDVRRRLLRARLRRLLFSPRQIIANFRPAILRIRLSVSARAALSGRKHRAGAQRQRAALFSASGGVQLSRQADGKMRVQRSGRISRLLPCAVPPGSDIANRRYRRRREGRIHLQPLKPCERQSCLAPDQGAATRCAVAQHRAGRGARLPPTAPSR